MVADEERLNPASPTTPAKAPSSEVTPLIVKVLEPTPLTSEVRFGVFVENAKDAVPDPAEINCPSASANAMDRLAVPKPGIPLIPVAVASTVRPASLAEIIPAF
jgi:hypothetical protein